MYFNSRNSEIYTIKFIIIVLSFFLMLFISFFIIARALKELKKETLQTKEEQWTNNKE